MLPRTKRRPLQLGDSIPKWLPHQREVNELLLSILKSRRDSILWCSSWDSPFPPRLGMFIAPQPDYVLIEDIGGGPQLTFGEHDRNSEPVGRFISRKIALYRAIARFPEACEQHFGIAHFRVQVTVTDPYRSTPIRRLRELIDAVRQEGASEIFRFTLGGWLHAAPGDNIWFDTNRTPAVDSAAQADHRQTHDTSDDIMPAGT